MAIVLNDNESNEYEVPVTVAIKLKNGNKKIKNFYATFNRLTKPEFMSRVKEIRKDLNSDEVDEDNLDVDLSIELIKENLVGWRQLTDFNEAPIEFNEANVEEVLGHPDYYAGFDTALADLCSPAKAGGKKASGASRKNSSR